jgi:hypothetical protein
MKALLRVRDQPESEDHKDDESEQKERGWERPVLRMRCYACAGSGRLEVVGKGARRGRIVRCIACGGTGKVTVE